MLRPSSPTAALTSAGGRCPASVSRIPPVPVRSSSQLYGRTIRADAGASSWTVWSSPASVTSRCIWRRLLGFLTAQISRATGAGTVPIPGPIPGPGPSRGPPSSSWRPVTAPVMAELNGLFPELTAARGRPVSGLAPVAGEGGPGGPGVRGGGTDWASSSRSPIWMSRVRIPAIAS